MQKIKKYAVKHPMLRNYIKFFWEIRTGRIELDHKIIPTRNINLRFNLSYTPFNFYHHGEESRLEDVFFAGLWDKYSDARLKFCGCSHVLGVCFHPEGFQPFLKIPLSEFKNQMFGAGEVGVKLANAIEGKLREAPDIETRLGILENELASMLGDNDYHHADFSKVFNALKINSDPLLLTAFCAQNGLSVRKLERMFNKYIGISAKTYAAMNRFQNSLNGILYSEYDKLSDIAYSQGYFDQAHFIRDFKRFSGNTPKIFARQNKSMLQIGKFD